MKNQRLPQLDGWRGISILFVLSAHLLPLGPSSWMINSASGRMGMALFFALSGFLITHFLYNGMPVKTFLIRRVFRILPLVWLYILIVYLIGEIEVDALTSHLLFYSNWPPMTLGGVTSHLWSLCVEMQFYISIAVICLIFNRKYLWFFIPVLCIAITCNRVSNEVYAAVNTYYRVDEILSGAILALIFNSNLESIKKFLRNTPPLIPLVLLALASHPSTEALNYLRPYLAAYLVGSTIYNDDSLIAKWLDNKILIYIAFISYALYVIHPLLAHSTWLGEGEGIEKYLKRPLLFIVLVSIAHVSTFYYEQKWSQLARKLTRKSI